jgi:hypothetical protein
MENTTEAPVLSPKETFPAKVAKVIDQYKLVINKGKIDGIRESQRMLVYCLDDDEIKDPDTGKSLGFLELVRGTGKIIFVQDEFSILESDEIYQKSIFPARQKFEERISSLTKFAVTSDLLREGTLKPFDKPQVGDLVKPI